MIFIIFGFSMVAMLYLILWLFIKAIDGSKASVAILLLLLAAFFALIAYVASNSNQDEVGPCLRWETRSMLVGKVATPYRVCLERGEWITDKDSK